MTKYLVLALLLVGCTTSEQKPVVSPSVRYEVVCPMTAIETIRDTIRVPYNTYVGYGNDALNFGGGFIPIKQYPSTCIAKRIAE